jgi:hypothetical protein
MAQRDAYESLLRRGGWPEPWLHQVRLSGRADWVNRAEGEWSGFLGRLHQQGWQATPWLEMTPEDHATVAAIAASAPEDQRPFTDGLYPPVCLAIRRHGQVVGWVLGREELRERHVDYPVGYVIAELRRSGWLIAGLMEACRRQAAALGPDSIAGYGTGSYNSAMQTFMLRRLSGRPELVALDQMFWAEKSLP